MAYEVVESDLLRQQLQKIFEKDNAHLLTFYQVYKVPEGQLQVMKKVLQQKKEREAIGKARVLVVTCQRKEPKGGDKVLTNGRGGATKAAEQEAPRKYSFTLYVCKQDGGTYAVGLAVDANYTTVQQTQGPHGSRLLT